MSTKSDSIENGGHMAGPSADTEADAPILPPLEELFGNEAQDLDDLFNSMLDVAVDPNTEMPEGDLIPDLDSFPEESAEDPSADEASHEVDLADLDDSGSLGETPPRRRTSPVILRVKLRIPARQSTRIWTI